MTSHTKLIKERLDSLVKDITSVPFSKSKARKLIIGFHIAILENEILELEKEKKDNSVLVEDYLGTYHIEDPHVEISKQDLARNQAFSDRIQTLRKELNEIKKML